MANRYGNLIGTNKISDEYPKINQAFDTVQQEVDALDERIEITEEYITTNDARSLAIEQNVALAQQDIDKAEADIEALDEKLDTIILNPIEGEVAAQEVILARGDAATLPKRLDGIDLQLAENVKTSRANGEKKCIVSFISDDGDDADYYVLKPIFDAAGVPCCSAIITGSHSLTDAHMTELAAAGWEFASHTVTHAHLPALTEAQIDDELKNSKAWIESKGYKCNFIVYPFGEHSETVRKIARKYYKFGVKTGASINDIPISTYEISRIAVGSYFDGVTLNTLEYYKAQFDEAYARGAWIVFMLHSGAAEFDATQQQHLVDLITYVKSFNVPILTMSQAYEYMGNAITSGDDGVVITNTGEIHGNFLKSSQTKELTTNALVWKTGTSDTFVRPINFIDGAICKVKIDGVETSIVNPTIVSTGKNIFGGMKAALAIVKAVNNPNHAWITKLYDKRVLGLKESPDGALLKDFFTGAFLPNQQYTISYKARRSDPDVASGGDLRFRFTDDTYMGFAHPASGDWQQITATSTAGKTVKAISGNSNGPGLYGTFYIDIDTLQVEIGTVSTAVEDCKESKLSFQTTLANGETIKQENDDWLKGSESVPYLGNLRAYKNGTIYVIGDVAPTVQITYPTNAKAAQEIEDKELYIANLKSDRVNSFVSSSKLTTTSSVFKTGTSDLSALPIDFLDDTFVDVKLTGLATPTQNITIYSTGKNIFGGAKAAQDIVSKINNADYAYMDIVDGRRVLAMKASNANIELVDFLTGAFLTNQQYRISYYARRESAEVAAGGALRFKFSDDTYLGGANPTSDAWEKITFVSTAGKTVKAISGSHYGIPTEGITYIDIDTLQVTLGTAENVYEDCKITSLVFAGTLNEGDVIRRENGKWTLNGIALPYPGALKVYKNGFIYIVTTSGPAPSLDITYPLNLTAVQNNRDIELLTLSKKA